MSKEGIEAIINEAGGPEYVLGWRLANGTKWYFSRYVLSMDDFVTLGGEDVVKLKHKDTSNREAISYLTLDEIVHIYTIVDLEGGITLRDILD